MPHAKKCLNKINGLLNFKLEYQFSDTSDEEKEQIQK